MKRLLYFALLLLPLFAFKCSESVSGGADELNSNTKWVLEKFGDETAQVPEGVETPYLKFDLNEKKLNGFGGCNNFFGNFFIKGDMLNISELGSTKKYCENSAPLEDRLMVALRAANTFKVKDSVLTLLQDSDEVAQFKAE